MKLKNSKEKIMMGILNKFCLLFCITKVENPVYSGGRRNLFGVYDKAHLAFLYICQSNNIY